MNFAIGDDWKLLEKELLLSDFLNAYSIFLVLIFSWNRGFHNIYLNLRNLCFESVLYGVSLRGTFQLVICKTLCAFA
jgi:hypothetical protein